MLQSKAQAEALHVFIDSTTVRTHQHAAGAPGKTAEESAFGRSHGGHTTKTHVAALTSIKPSPSAYGQTGDCTQFDSLYDDLPEDNILASASLEKGYDTNRIGLSEQVPSHVVFLTDGPDRRVKIGKREIILQHTTPRNMATAERRSGTFIQALRYLGQDQIDDRVRTLLRRHVAQTDSKALRKDLIHAPAWIADLLRPLIESTANS